MTAGNQLYVEPFSGLSGDMFLGALCALSGAYRLIEELPRTLGLDDARIAFEDVSKNGIRCRAVRITDLAAGDDGGHRHGPVRRLDGLLQIIDGSAINAGAKRISRAILVSLAEVEAGVHGVGVDEVHFHEVGAVDSLLDIVGNAVLLDRLEIQQTYSDPVCTGFGTVSTEHGVLPVPAPATAALLCGMPSFKGNEPGERVTPTGAAILRFLAPSFNPPALSASIIGYGAGRKDFEAPNVLRLSLVEPAECASTTPACLAVECNIDDAPPEYLGGDMHDDLRACGALDVFLTPTQMKKGRLGIQLTALVPWERLDAVTDWLLENTSTIGLRWHEVRRRELPRQGDEIDTPYGRVQIKAVTTPSGARRLKIEYESLRRISQDHGLSLRAAEVALMRWLEEPP